jgi:carboxymethylenebutenolidase
LTDVTIQTAHGELPAYLATPSTPGPWPGVVVIHDAMGHGADVRQQADWLAAAGFLAVAPNLFFWSRTLTCIRSAFADMRRGKGQLFDDVELVRTFLAGQVGCTGQLGVIGFCMGGGFALLLAPDHGFAASSINYGTVPKDARAALAGACPVIGSFGGRDRTLRGAADRLDRALTENGISHDVKEYPTAGHGFLNDHLGAGDKLPMMISLMKPLMGFGPDAAATADARARIITFFTTHLNPAA